MNNEVQPTITPEEVKPFVENQPIQPTSPEETPGVTPKVPVTSTVA